MAYRAIAAGHFTCSLSPFYLKETTETVLEERKEAVRMVLL